MPPYRALSIGARRWATRCAGVALVAVALALPLSAAAQTQPDLLIQDLRLSPPAARSRDTVTATVTVRNAGQVPADPAAVALYFARSTETPLELATPLGTATSPLLAPGASAPIPMTFTVPDVPPGSFQIVAVVDGPGLLAETNNSNNRRSTTLQITFPDLTLQDLRLAPSAASARDSVTATVIVRNAGRVPADPAAVALYFAPSGETPLELATPLGTTTSPLLAPGASAPIPMTFTVPDVPPGSFQIVAVVDGPGLLAETNNSNNRRSTTLQITFPDLTLQDLRLAPSAARARDSVTATVVVRNAGRVPADPAAVALYFAPSGETPLELATPLATATSPLLTPGASAPIPMTFGVPDVPPGSFQIVAVVDGPDRIAETNNSNNRRSTSLRVALPDLQATGLALVPTLTRAGDVVTTTISVRNGSDVPSATTTGALFVTTTASAASIQAATPTTTFEIPGLGPGKAVTLKVPLPVPVIGPGSYSLVVRVDPSAAVGESNETNNTRTIRFEVGMPDVMVADLTVAPGVVQPGQVAVANLRVGNSGRAPSRATTLDVFLATSPDAAPPAGLSVTTLPVDSIPANGSLQLTAPVTIPTSDPGTYYLIAQLDAATAVGPWTTMLTSTAAAAVAPTGQVRRKAIKLVLQMPDLVVSELSLDSTLVRPGTALGATFTIKNMGSAAAAANVAALLLGDCATGTPSVLKTVPVPTLGSGASTRLTTTATVPAVSPGTHCVIVRADSTRIVGESIESNNDRVASLQVKDLNVTLVPHLDPTQDDVPYPLHSHYKHPWRAWLDTQPASVFLGGVGLNYHIDTPRARDDVEMRLLADSGIGRIRVEVGWGRTDYTSLDLLPATKATLTSILNAAKANGIRPLILLNGHHGYPVPHRELSPRTVSATAGAGSRTVQLSDVSGISPGYTGFTNLTDYRMAEVIITAVNASTRTVTLAKPLPITLGAGRTVRLDTLRFQPLSEPGTPAFEETAAGWLEYVRATVRAVMATGITDFDVEIWNELTFGSDFLGINAYYSPPIVTERDPLRPGGRCWELARRTVAMLAAEFPRVEPIWGFSNTTFFYVSVTALPTGTLGQSYHPYEFAEYDSPTDEHLGMANNLEHFAPLTPPYRVVMPEGAGMLIRSDAMIRHLTPEGRQERPPSTPEFRHYMTEWGFNPSGYGIGDLDEAELLKARALLRSAVFWLNKGITGLYFFGDFLDGDLLKYDLMPLSIAQLSSYPSNPDAVLPLAFKALGNAARAFRGATPVTTPRQLGAEIAAADGQGGGIIFRGDATHPDLTYQDALGVFPFQVDARTFVVALYVMSRNILETLPETPFIVKLINLDGRNATLQYLDPLTGTTRPVDVIERTASTLVVSLPVGDTPFLLTIAE